MNAKLIIDIGMSEGNDTAFYLAKGFDVVGVEADPITFSTLEARFQQEIASKRLTLVHAAASARGGETVEFWRNDTHQGLSSTYKDGQASEGGRQTKYDVKTVSWRELRLVRHVPYYLKLDVEGAETPFLQSMFGAAELPQYISVEAHSFSPVQLVFDLGYRRFKLVSQTILHTFEIPDPSLEGDLVSQPNWHHASGPFGQELPGEWVDFEVFQNLYEAVDLLRRHRTAQHTWFDCHATF